MFNACTTFNPPHFAGRREICHGLLKQNPFILRLVAFAIESLSSNNASIEDAVCGYDASENQTNHES